LTTLRSRTASNASRQPPSEIEIDLKSRAPHASIMKASHFLIILLTTAVLAPLVSAVPEPKHEVYKTVDDVSLSLEIFTPETHQPTDSRPAALFFFGGGWSSGSTAQFVPHARYLATRGMVGIVADYRVSSRHKTTPFEAVKDAKSAVRWVRAHAKRLGIDPNRLAVGGGSAGGHLAAATATIEGINEANDDLSVSAFPNALLLFNPVYDNGPGGFGYKQFQDRHTEISPIHNIRKGIPPTVVFLGTNDALIPTTTGKQFQEKMQAVGSRSELFLYQGQTHGFFNQSSSPRHYYETMLQTDVFLTSLGFLSGNPTISPPKFALSLKEDAHALEVTFGGTPLARYEFAFDASTPERRLETYKPFLHVYDKNGARVITKGAGGQFTHHRGIFLGFNRMKIGEQSYDLWHMKEGVQVHQRFSVQSVDQHQAQFTSVIHWQDNAGKVLIEEQRTFTFHQPPGRAYALIEMASNLKALVGDVSLSGDPEHAGAHFRPADDTIAAETTYTFHKEGIDPKKDLDLPWVGATFRLATGKNKYSAVILNHPDNPRNTRFSAYRDYGRFGAFPELKIAQGESAKLRYQWIVNGGKMLAHEVIEKTHADFSQANVASKPIRVLVWDEQQPVRTKVYENFPGNFIADHLKKHTRLKVTTANLNEDGLGLTTESLENTDVLVYWGHVRHDDIPEAKGQEIVDRIKDGKLSMITLHSAHWALPFRIAMEERLKEDVLAPLPARLRESMEVEFVGERERKTPPVDKRLAFATTFEAMDGGMKLSIERPNCVFPRCCTPKQPSQIRMFITDHPIAKNVPTTFTIPETEMYDEPFHIPSPDLLIFDETWAGGEYFRSGCLWNIGKGKVFYFRPGDQQYAVYKVAPILKILENTCLWLGDELDGN
jgi:acetyl esterase